MPNRKIDRPNFLTLDGITYSFNMTDHLNPQLNKDQILTDICKMISTAYKADFPIWARLLADHRIILITPQDELYQYLDEDAREKFFNFLIFKKDGSDCITVTHFGPFGNKKEDEFQDNLDKIDRALAVLKKALAWLKSPENTMSAEKKKEGEKYIRNQVIKNYWAIVIAVRLELQELIQKVYIRAGVKEAANKRVQRIRIVNSKVCMKVSTAILFTEKIGTKIAAKGAEKGAEKGAVKAAAKAAAKTAAKTSSKGASKIVMKSVPILGLVMGTAFGAWRLCHGDLIGAGLEVASGAASCVPGAGTAASLAIDAGLIAKDVYEAKCEHEKLKWEIKKVENEWNDLYVKCDKANEEYEFAKEVLKDPGFTMEKLEHEIEMLDVVSHGLHNITKQSSTVLGKLCTVLLCCFLCTVLLYCLFYSCGSV